MLVGTPSDLSSFKQLRKDDDASSSSSILNGFQTRMLLSAETLTKVLSTRLKFQTASVWPFRFLTKTFGSKENSKLI